MTSERHSEIETVAVIIPCYKVSKTIKDVVCSAIGEADHVIVIDDCCPEGSGLVVQELNLDNVHVLFNSRNEGVGGAVIAGFRKAMEMGIDIMVKVDGDGQMDLRHLDEMIGPIRDGQADYTKGNRFRQLARLEEMPRIRLVGNSALSFLVKAASGYWDIMDPTNGFTAIHRTVLEKIDLDKISMRYFFETDMLIHLNIINAVVKDVPIPAKYGSGGSSLRVERELLSFPPRLFRGLVRRILTKYFLYDFNMASLYLLIGMPVFLASVVFGAYQWIVSLITNEVRSAGTIMLAALPIIVSFQMLLQAVNIDMMSVPKTVIRPPRK